jgi:hypothetical protein
VLFLDETNVAGPLWGGGAAIRAAMSTRPRSGDAFPHQWKKPPTTCPTRKTIIARAVDRHGRNNKDIELRFRDRLKEREEELKA